jgi:hypothetical protein
MSSECMPDTAEIGNLEDNNMYSTFWARNIKTRPIHGLIVQCIVGYKSWMVYGFYDLYKGLIRLYGKVADSLMSTVYQYHKRETYQGGIAYVVHRPVRLYNSVPVLRPF